MSRPALLERYRDALPLEDGAPIVSLGEGSTPLVPAARLSARLGLEVWLKYEGTNPTGSFKDRGMAVAVTKALAAGFRGVVCASTGNTAASAAAYAARAGLRAVLVLPARAVAAGKLAQARAVGAEEIAVEGSFSDAFDAAEELARREGYAVVNSTNPDRIEGQKTAALEIVEEIGVPDALVLPYGGGGNTTAYRLGFEFAGRGLPRIFPVQAADRAATLASAIRITRPAHADEVANALEASHGALATVDDADLAAAWRSLARDEGIFCEPASAAPVAALPRLGLPEGSRVVCVVTGHGLKDVDAVGRWGHG